MDEVQELTGRNDLWPYSVEPNTELPVGFWTDGVSEAKNALRVLRTWPVMDVVMNTRQDSQYPGLCLLTTKHRRTGVALYEWRPSEDELPRHTLVRSVNHITPSAADRLERHLASWRVMMQYAQTGVVIREKAARQIVRKAGVEYANQVVDFAVWLISYQGHVEAAIEMIGWLRNQTSPEARVRGIISECEVAPGLHTLPPDRRYDVLEGSLIYLGERLQSG